VKSVFSKRHRTEFPITLSISPFRRPSKVIRMLRAKLRVERPMATLSFGSSCPRCGKAAPIALRGFDGHCVACGAPRVPLTAPTVSLAGGPARFGGAAALFAGWSVLVLGLSVAVGLLLLLQSIWPGTLVGWAFGIPVAVVSLFFGLLLLVGGRRLRRHGRRRRRSVELEAAQAAIAHRSGVITTSEAALALGVSEEQADSLLTELSRDSTVEVNVEFDDDGRLRYLFGAPAERFRVLEERAARGAEQADDGRSTDVSRTRRR
jgi:hypothetical protein